MKEEKAPEIRNSHQQDTLASRGRQTYQKLIFAARLMKTTTHVDEKYKRSHSKTIFYKDDHHDSWIFTVRR